MWRYLLFIGVVVIVLSSCTPLTTPTAVSTPSMAGGQAQAAVTGISPAPALVTSPAAPPASQTPTPTPVPSTHTPTITRTPIFSTTAPTMVACMRAGGRVEVYEFTTVLLPDPLVYRIYLPPCYDEDKPRSYPVLYLIHGQTYTDTQWDRLGVPGAADRLIASGEVAPFIVVMPRDRVWREPTEDNFGLAVEQSLVPWVDGHYRTIANREHRAVGGLSRGGAWAIHLGLSHPEIFGAVGVHSGFVFHTDVQPLHQWLSNLPDEIIPRIYMDIADKDRPEISQSSTWLEQVLTQYSVPHEWHIFVGEHEEEYWMAHVEDYLRWYTQAWAASGGL